MLRLTRPKNSPEILRTQGLEKAQALCDLYDQSAPHRNGTEPFSIADTYRDLSVRKSLERAQHDKCCYCDAKATQLQVEHYRPKNAVRQKRDAPEEKPGYYWLAYEWQNLMLACGLCNQLGQDSAGNPTGKGTQFPLADPAMRARSHHESLAQEDPLLLDPYADNPDDHIGYRECIPYPLTSRGEATIEVLKLRGKSQLSRPRTTYADVKKKLAWLGTESVLPPQYQQEIIEELWQMAGDSAEYAAMVRAALKEWGLPPAP